jgi:hypothetical protein
MWPPGGQFWWQAERDYMDLTRLNGGGRFGGMREARRALAKAARRIDRYGHRTVRVLERRDLAGSDAVSCPRNLKRRSNPGQ